MVNKAAHIRHRRSEDHDVTQDGSYTISDNDISIRSHEPTNKTLVTRNFEFIVLQSVDLFFLQNPYQGKS
jgi:hypothetical protein